MDNQEKIDEWLHLNSTLLESVQISTFISVTVPENNNLEDEHLLQMNRMEKLFLFFSNFSREYLTTHLAKIIDPDNKSITIYNFFSEAGFYRQGFEYKAYKEWKKKTKSFCKKVQGARNRFSSHTDKASFHDKEYFGLYIEDCDEFLKETFEFFDILYDGDDTLKKSFDEIIGMGFYPKIKPSELAQTRKVSMAKDVLYLEKVSRES